MSHMAPISFVKLSVFLCVSNRQTNAGRTKPPEAKMSCWSQCDWSCSAMFENSKNTLKLHFTKASLVCFGCSSISGSVCLSRPHCSAALVTFPAQCSPHKAAAKINVVAMGRETVDCNWRREHSETKYWQFGKPLLFLSIDSWGNPLSRVHTFHPDCFFFRAQWLGMNITCGSMNAFSCQSQEFFKQHRRKWARRRIVCIYSSVLQQVTDLNTLAGKTLVGQLNETPLCSSVASADVPLCERQSPLLLEGSRSAVNTTRLQLYWATPRCQCVCWSIPRS